MQRLATTLSNFALRRVDFRLDQESRFSVDYFLEFTST